LVAKVQAVLGRCLDGISEPELCYVPRCRLCIEITDNSCTCDNLECLHVDGDPGIESSPPVGGGQRHARSMTLPSGDPLIGGTYRDHLQCNIIHRFRQHVNDLELSGLLAARYPEARNLIAAAGSYRVWCSPAKLESHDFAD
jgi:hypothetical protein